ncbi:MAG: PAS domain-containing protein [Melioribacteraceae bacterium]|nr:PAS domain-containing protein [Melioribacteraceae bacterium]
MEKTLTPEDFLLVISSFFNETKEGVIILDVTQLSFPIVYINKGFCDTTGYSINDVLGKDLSVIFDTHSKDNSYNDHIKNIENPKSFSFISQIVKKDRSIFEAFVSGTPVPSYNKNIEYIFLIIDDISDKKKYIEEKASLKALRVVINTINDVLFNYMNYLKLFQDELVEINDVLNDQQLKKLTKEYKEEYSQIFNALTKFSDLSSFKTKTLSEGFEILDVNS